MTTSRAAAESLETIRKRVRRKLGDPDSRPNGATIPPEVRRHSDQAIHEAINDQCMEMGTAMAIRDFGEALSWVDFVYAESDDGDGSALPAGIDANGIHKVEDRSAAYPYSYDYVSALEIERYQDGRASADTESIDRKYTLVADPASTGYRIMIRPAPSGRTVRIHHIATPLIANTEGDPILLSSRWREYIALGAAIKLLSIDDEAPEKLITAYEAIGSQFRSFCNRQKGPQRVRSVRTRTT